MVFNIKPQKFDVLEKTHPDLFTMINKTLPDLTTEQKGKVAGLVIEYVIQSEGDIDIFQDPYSSMVGEEEQFD